jgi:hypothetical protein
MKSPTRIVLIFLNAVEIRGMGVKPVIAELIQHPECDQKAAGHADGQARDIYKRISLVLENIPECDFDQVFQHTLIPSEIGFHNF